MVSILPSYTHIVNPRLKHIYLTFDDEGGLIIKTPRVSQDEIEKVLLKKAGWISRSRQKIQAKKGKPPRFREEEEVFFLGTPYPLSLQQHQKGITQLTFDEKSGFSLHYDHYDTDLFDQLFDRFYKKKAQEFVPPVVKSCSEIMQLFPAKISFRKAKKRWGSCSNSNAISFNYLMMKLPVSLIEYIVVHELAHIRHKHHQKSFWDLVAETIPDYRKRREALKNYL